MTDIELVGCPLCPASKGCCAFKSVAEVRGTNDPTVHPSGASAIWMHQHPNVSESIGGHTAYPFRQHKRPFDGIQADLTPPDVDPLVTQSYVQWRPDGSEVVYWEIRLDRKTGTTGQPLFRMSPDGTARQQIPLPADLCATHPSYLDKETIVFSGWRCGGTPCSCAPSAL